MSRFYYLICALAFLASYLTANHFLPWTSWHNEVFAFLAVLLVVWYLWVRIARKTTATAIALPILTLPFIGLSLLAILQSATGLITFGGSALIIWFYFALCIACLILGYAFGVYALVAPDSSAKGMVDKRFPLIALGALLVTGAFVSGIVAFVQVFDLWRETDWINRMQQLRRPGGNLGQPNQLATLLLMGMVSLLFLYESNRIQAAPSALILLVLTIALGLTESRTGILSLLLLLGWWFAKRRSVGFKLDLWMPALVFIGFLAFFGLWPSLFDCILQNANANSEVNTTSGVRLVVWPQLLEALVQRPWLGWGLGEVSKAHNAVAHAFVVSLPFSYSHNILLDLALGMGVPLTILLVVVCSGWLWRCVRNANQLMPWYCLALVLPVAVHSMLEFPFAYAYFLVPVMFALGALEGLAGNKPAFRLGVRPAAALLLVASSLAAWSVLEYFAIEEDFRVARFEALRVGQTPNEYQRPKVMLLTQLDALLKGARIIPKPGMNFEELELAKKVALRYPWTATQNRYALSLALNGNPEEAMRQMRVMRAMHGEKTYAGIKENWNNLAQDKYPQLRELTLP
jgi:O-antigen ligase